MREMLDSEPFAFRFEVGVTDVSNRLQLHDRQRIVNSIMKYFTVVRSKAQVDQLREGLAVMGVGDLMTSNASMFRKLLTEKPPLLTADYMLDLFITEFSLSGSNRREAEEQAALYWINFIQLIECKSHNSQTQV